MCADSRGYLEPAAGPGGCMSSFTPVSADAREKGKVIFYVWPVGKTEANDLGHVDCYLAPRIALYFLGASNRECGQESTRRRGWGAFKCV